MQDKNPVAGKTGYFLENAGSLKLVCESIRGADRNIQLFFNTSDRYRRAGKKLQQKLVRQFSPTAKDHYFLFISLAQLNNLLKSGLSFFSRLNHRGEKKHNPLI